MAEPRGFSFAAGLAAIVTAFVVGLLASLAVRPPGRVAATTGSGETPVHNQVRWRVPTSFGTHLPAIGEAVTEIGKRLAAASDGAVVLEVFEPGELVPAFSITESVRDGKVDAGFTWVGYDQGRIPASTLIAAVPFGMEPWEFLAWWYDAGGRELGEGLYHAQNVHPVLCTVIGPETAGWFRTPVNSLADFDGMKIRFAGLGGKVMQRVGASVTLLPPAEIFQALEKGAIDATEFSLPVVDRMLGFGRVAKYNYFPGWHQTFSSMHLLVNLDSWRALAPATRALIELGCQASVTYGLARSEALQGEVIAGFADIGVTAGRLPTPILESLRKLTDEVLAEEAAADADFAEILASQRAFRETYRHWKVLGYLPRDF